MGRGTYSTRPFGDDDYEAVARLNAVIEPGIAETVEDALRWHELITRNSGRLVLRLVVEEPQSRALVAWGVLTHTLWNFHPQKFYIRVAVHPGHRGRGIGQGLYARLEQQAMDRDAVCLWGAVREDHLESVRFLERQGFVPQRKTWPSRLGLTDLDLSGFPDRANALRDQGIRITTLAREGVDRLSVRRRPYELSRITSEDEPRMGDYTPPTFEEYVETGITGPKVLPDAIFLACRSEEYVGATALQRVLGSPDTLDIWFTGTLSKFRGRGIASKLKLQAVEYARAHAFRFLTTSNDSHNPSIWSINEKLGFRKEEIWVESEKALSSPRR
jgi:mycothiol synthase